MSRVNPLQFRVDRIALALDVLMQRVKTFEDTHEFNHPVFNTSIIEAVLARVPLPTIICKTLWAHPPLKPQLRRFDRCQVLTTSLPMWSAMTLFIQDKFFLTNCVLFPELEGKLYTELPQYIQRRINETQVHVLNIETTEEDVTTFLESLYITLGESNAKTT
jgi:hypothetical protein